MGDLTVSIRDTLADTDDFTQGASRFVDNQDAFLRKVQSWWNKSDSFFRPIIRQEQERHAFVMGHQWDPEDARIIRESGRVPLVINKVLPHLLIVSGYERNNRLRVRYLPVEKGDDLRAQVWTEVARVVQENGLIDFAKSAAFFDMLKGGRGFYHLRVDYSDNPSGEIKAEVVPPWELRLDPNHYKPDLSDCRYIIWAKEVSLEEILALWPDKAEELLAMNDAVSAKGHFDFAVSSLEETAFADYKDLSNWAYNRTNKTWRLLEVWYWEVQRKGRYLVYNPDMAEWQPIQDKESLAALLAVNPDLQWEDRDTWEKKYYQAFVVGPVVLEHGESPYQFKGFPFIPIYGMWDAAERRYLGLAEFLLDPQREINKRRTQILHILNRAAKMGWLGPEGSFVNIEKWESESSKPGVVLTYDQNFGKPERLDPPPIPASYLQMEQMATADLRDISLVNLELLGLGVKDTPGVVVSQRQRQGLLGLQIYFDNLRYSTKLMGRLLLSLMKQYYTDGRQFIINGFPPDNLVVLDASYRVGRYDLIAEEAPYSPNQKLETVAKLQMAIDVAAKLKVPIPPDVLEYLDLPQALVEKWKDMLTQFAPPPPGVPPGGAAPVTVQPPPPGAVPMPLPEQGRLNTSQESK